MNDTTKTAADGHSEPVAAAESLCCTGEARKETEKTLSPLEKYHQSGLSSFAYVATEADKERTGRPPASAME